MRVFAVPADASACGFYRIQAPATAIGPDVHVAPPEYPRHKGPEEVPVRFNAGDAEVVVVHRPAFPAVVHELERLQAQGYPVVVDVDDDLSCAPRGHIGNDEMADCQAKACGMADLVTCSSDALAARYGAHGRVQVLRNGVPAAMLDLERSSDGHTLGWAGLASGHLGDLPVTGGAVSEALGTRGWRFRQVGPAEDVRVQLGLTEPFAATGPLSLAGYQQELGILDAGICPLAHTLFNAAKSGLKPIEMAARGVPSVTSSSPEYARLAGEDIGLLAHDRAGWVEQLSRLMGDDSFRSEMAARGRARVATHHTYEGNAARWLEAWQAAIENRRRR